MKLEVWKQLTPAHLPEGYYWYIKPWFDDRGVKVQLRRKRKYWRDWRSMYKRSMAYNEWTPEHTVNFIQRWIIERHTPYEALPQKRLR